MIHVIDITYLPIDLGRIAEAVSDESCGASVLFLGTTRRWTSHVQADAVQDIERPPIRETSHLIYDAYREMALTKLQELAGRASQRWPIRKLAIVHRVGRVDPMEPSVAIAVSTPHRREAFEAGQWLIDTLKHEVPIWKQEHYIQNESEWIHPTAGSCDCLPEHATVKTAALDGSESKEDS